MPPILSFYDEDDLSAHLTEAEDGTKLIIFGVEGERAVVMPLTQFLHLIGIADDECAKQAILIRESMNKTRH
jgi:hypothetical protein